MSLYNILKTETPDEKRDRRADACLTGMLGGIREDSFTDYTFNLSFEVNLPFTNEPSEYLNWFNGTITYIGDDLEDDEYENGKVCGKLMGFLVNFEQAMNKGVRRFDILDSLDDEFIDCARLFNTRSRNDSYLTKAANDILLAQFEDFYTIYQNFIYIKRLEISAEHRGKRVGTYFLEQSLLYLAQTLPIDFFAMKPFPLQREGMITTKDEWEESLELHKLEKNWNKSLHKLRDLYGELGFDLVKGTNLMICTAEMYK